ncbi:MAG: hypothetical protein Q8934_21735 [Bacillota bacterium]|nr:hypothetical protein [Bacillota bacterium]
MSISINPNLTSYDLANYLGNTQNTNSNSRAQNSQFLNDLLNISNVGQTGNNGSLLTQFLPTGNYGPTISEPPLTTDQKKQFLENLQVKVNSADSTSSSNGQERFAAVQSTIKNDLSGFDASTATDDQVSKLFDQVTQTMKSARAHHHESNSQNNSNSSNSTLSVDDMKPYISNLIDKLSFSGVDSTDGTDSTDESTGPLLNPQDSSLGDLLSGFDSANATDDQVQNLFTTVTNLLNNSQDQGKDDPSLQTSEFPTVLQTSGATLPPFNWKPSTTL